MGAVVSTNISELILWSRGLNPGSYRDDLVLVKFCRERTPTEIDFYSSHIFELKINNGIISLPEFAVNHHLTLREGGAFAYYYQTAREMIDDVYNKE